MARRVPLLSPAKGEAGGGERRARLDWGALSVRLVLAAILAVAAFTKIEDPTEVITTVGRAGLTPSGWDHAVAYAIIGAELGLAALLIPRRTAVFGAAGYAGLASVFFGYSIWRWWQDIKAPCGCFGLLLRLVPWHGALLSSLMCLAALLALRGLTILRPALGTLTATGTNP